MMTINIYDDKLGRLYFLAEKRNLDYELDVGFGMAAWVDSFSNPENNYYVTIKDEEAQCHCQAALNDQACSHVAVAVAHFFPSLWLKWFSDDCNEFQRLRHKIITQAALTLSEKRKVNKAVREVEAAKANELNSDVEREAERAKMDNSVLTPTFNVGEKLRGIRL